MRRARACIGGDADDCLAIELYRQARSQIVCNENLVRPLWQIDRIVIRQSKEDRQDANVDVDQIPDSLADQRTRVVRELLAPFEHHQVEGFFSAEILMNELLDLPNELAVLED